MRTPLQSRRAALGQLGAGLLSLGAAPLLGCDPARGGPRTPPDTPDSIAVRLPAIARREFGGDAQLYLMEDRRTPLVALAVTVQAGFADDPPGQAGLASLWRAHLRERDPSRYHALGSDRWTRLTASSFGLGCTVRREHARAALGLLIDELRSLDATPLEFMTLRRVRLEELAATRGDPRRVGGYGLVLASVEADPPSAALPTGSSVGVEALTLADLQRWRDEYLRPSLASFAIAGAIGLDEATDAIADAASAWAVPAQREGLGRAEPLAMPHDRYGAVLVDWPGNREAILSLAITAADYADASALELELAGRFVSGSLLQALREQQRISYALGLERWATRAGPLHQRWTAIAADQMATALATIESHVARWHEQPQRLRLACEATLTSWRLSEYVALMREYETVEAALEQLLAMAEVRLPVEAAHQRLTQMRDFDGDRLARVILDQYAPDRLRWSVVADSRTIAALEAGLGDQPRAVRRPAQLVV